MKRLVVAFCLVLFGYPLVSVSSADIIHPAHPTPYYWRIPRQWLRLPKSSPSVSPAPSNASPSPPPSAADPSPSASVSVTSPAIIPSVSPAPSAARPSRSASVSKASPAILGSGVLVAALATGSLLGIVLIRKRKPQG